MRRATALLAVLLLSCASDDAARQRAQTWNARIGNWTYDQTIADYGPPLSRADGLETFVAEWGRSTSHQQIIGRREPIVCNDPNRFCNPYPGDPGRVITVTHGWELRLVFEAETQVLRSWSYRIW